jgi:hypothetical protein
MDERPTKEATTDSETASCSPHRTGSPNFRWRAVPHHLSGSRPDGSFTPMDRRLQPRTKLHRHPSRPNTHRGTTCNSHRLAHQCQPLQQVPGRRSSLRNASGAVPLPGDANGSPNDKSARAQVLRTQPQRRAPKAAPRATSRDSPAPPRRQPPKTFLMDVLHC